MFAILQTYGLKDPIYELLKWFLSNRGQVIQVGISRSSEEIIKCGVSQGTVLGPIRFLIYINSLIKMKESEDAICFADDIVIDLLLKYEAQLKTQE